jgi:hypothetical protein
MHPLLRTLDPAAGVGLESSVYTLHPIRQAAPPRVRQLPILLSLGLTALLILGLSESRLYQTPDTGGQRPLEARRSITFSLLEATPSPGRTTPVQKLVGPPGPGGAGHREGTDQRDPMSSATRTSLLTRPSEAVDPDAMGLAPLAERMDLSLNPTLAVQAEGNGLARGTGRDAAQGAGGLIRPPVPVKVLDLQLIPTRQVKVMHQLIPGEDATTREPVRVRILIGDDGVPFQASILSGPGFLHEEALKAAREWRFEPLRAHGLKAPLSLTLIFYPSLLRPR